MTHVKDSAYFSHDSNARRDPKILALRSVYGMEGYGRFWAIVEMLREQPDFKLRIDNKYSYKAIAMELECSEEQAVQFVQECIHEFGLFESDGEYFWSNSLLRRMQIKENRSKKARRAAMARWGNVGEPVGNANAMQTHSEISPSNASKGKESKGNISKENISTSIRERVLSTPVQEILDSFNRHCPSLPPVTHLTQEQVEALSALWDTEALNSMDKWDKLFIKVEGSDFLTGRNGKWKGCNFDWLIQAANISKVLRGAYDNSGPPKESPRQQYVHQRDPEELRPVIARKTMLGLGGGGGRDP